MQISRIGAELNLTHLSYMLGIRFGIIHLIIQNKAEVTKFNTVVEHELKFHNNILFPIFWME